MFGANCIKKHNPLPFVIRSECPGDYNDILHLTYKAFMTLNYPGRLRLDEHFLISLIQNSPFIIPELCFVATIHENDKKNEKIVGHIFYTKSKVRQANGTEINTITFGPLSVDPEYQRQGIGVALILHSINKAREFGFGAVLIVGVPDYYIKLGFKRAREYCLQLSDGTADESFMAYELMLHLI